MFINFEFPSKMADVDRKKTFSGLEKELFLNIIQKYDPIVTSKQTNASSALKKKQSWEKIAHEFNESSIVTQKASTKQLIKLWYNMKAKARESKAKENVRLLTGGGPSVMDMDPIDMRVLDVEKNILTNIHVDIDSDIDGSVEILGDTNSDAWCKKEENKKLKTPIRNRYENTKNNKLDFIKYQILEEELEFKKKLHEEELKIKILEAEHKKKIYELELKIKLKQLEKVEE